MHFDESSSFAEEIKQIIFQIKSLKEKLKVLDPKCDESLNEIVCPQNYSFLEEPPNHEIHKNVSDKTSKNQKDTTKNHASRVYKSMFKKGRDDSGSLNDIIISPKIVQNKNPPSPDISYNHIDPIISNNYKKFSVLLDSIMDFKTLAEELHNKLLKVSEKKCEVQDSMIEKGSSDGFEKICDTLLHQINNTYSLLEICSQDHKRIIDSINQIDKNVSNLSNLVQNASSEKIGALVTKDTSTTNQDKFTKLKRSYIKQKKRLDNGKIFEKETKTPNMDKMKIETPDSTVLPQPPTCWIRSEKYKSKELNSITIVYGAILTKCNKCKRKKCKCNNSDSELTNSVSKSKCKKCLKKNIKCKNCIKYEGKSELLIPETVENITNLLEENYKGFIKKERTSDSCKSEPLSCSEKMKTDNLRVTSNNKNTKQTKNCKYSHSGSDKQTKNSTNTRRTNNTESEKVTKSIQDEIMNNMETERLFVNVKKPPKKKPSMNCFGFFKN